jgi:hypothetical protein
VAGHASRAVEETPELDDVDVQGLNLCAAVRGGAGTRRWNNGAAPSREPATGRGVQRDGRPRKSAKAETQLGRTSRTTSTKPVLQCRTGRSRLVCEDRLELVWQGRIETIQLRC